MFYQCPKKKPKKNHKFSTKCSSQKGKLIINLIKLGRKSSNYNLFHNKLNYSCSRKANLKTSLNIESFSQHENVCINLFHWKSWNIHKHFKQIRFFPFFEYVKENFCCIRNALTDSNFWNRFPLCGIIYIHSSMGFRNQRKTLCGTEQFLQETWFWKSVKCENLTKKWFSCFNWIAIWFLKIYNEKYRSVRQKVQDNKEARVNYWCFYHHTLSHKWLVWLKKLCFLCLIEKLIKHPYDHEKLKCYGNKYCIIWTAKIEIYFYYIVESIKEFISVQHDNVFYNPSTKYWHNPDKFIL